MHKIIGFVAGALSVVTVGVVPVSAQMQDTPVVGDWACSFDLRVYITRFGSIEILGGDPAYRAGLIDVEGEIMTVTWDEGGETAVLWTLSDNTLTLDGLADEPLTCIPRD